MLSISLMCCIALSRILNTSEREQFRFVAISAPFSGLFRYSPRMTVASFSGRAATRLSIACISAWIRAAAGFVLLAVLSLYGVFKHYVAEKFVALVVAVVSEHRHEFCIFR